MESANRCLQDCWRRLIAFLSIMLVCGLASGCQTLSGDASEKGVFDRLLSTSGIRGPLERSLADSESVVEAGRRYSPQAQQEVNTAQDHLEKGDYETAAKMFKAAAKKYKESSVGEQAQFGLAEAWYAQGKLAKAQDAYDQLFVDYPSTRYVEPASRRLFAIAREWLEISDPVAKSEIRQVSGEKVLDEDPVKPAPPKDPTLRYRILPNFHDGSRPVFDTQGRALQALKAIWLNDPTGPLADDALMLTATYYQRNQNYVEADRYFKILREEYPNSPHFEKSYLLGSHVKLMSYQGPYYEGRELDAAAKLKEQSLHLFPVSEQRGVVRDDLNRIYLLQAQRAWSQIEYYQKKGRPRAIAIACMQLISDYPDTRYAADARGILRTIDRRELVGLPDIEQFLNSLPESEPDEDFEPMARAGVKSVSDSRADEPANGRIRL